MQNEPQSVIVIIADTNFVIPVYVLVFSLKFFQPEQRIHILGISLSTEEKALFEQFEKVTVFDSSIPRSDEPGAMRIIADILKGEALLTAETCEEPWIALLDGDCIATGDLTPFLQPGEPALYVRSRSEQEDRKIFYYYREESETRTAIPAAFLDRWQNDVGERSSPARSTTVLSGNLILHRDLLPFAETWTRFMKEVLPHQAPDTIPPAYYMPAEFCLSALLMFSKQPPPVREVLLNSDPHAYLAHLGPAPKYWKLWTRRNIRHFDRVMALLAWAEESGYAIPLLPSALKKRKKRLFMAMALGYEVLSTVRKQVKRLHKNFFGTSPQAQAQRYGRSS